MAQDNWMNQGRQSHGWFGHGTSPDKAASPQAPARPLAERIHDLGHTLVAGLPKGKRHHDAGRLSAEDHARLDRLMAAVVQALPLGLPAIARRVFGVHPDTPGLKSFVDAGRVLLKAGTSADLRTATDLMADSAKSIGLDHFKPFLRRADEHLTQQGGLLTLVKDMPAPAPLAAKAPARPEPPSPNRPLMPLGAARGLGAIGLAAKALEVMRQHAEADQVQAAIERFKLDAAKPQDLAAARGYVWAQYHGPMLFGTPFAGPEMEAMAERVLRADPALLDRALAGDDAPLKAAVQAAPVPGSGIETRSDEERSLVAQMVREGRSSADIQAALDARRGRSRTQVPQAAGTMPPKVQQIPPEQLRFSQRTAGGRGRAVEQRDYVQKNGTIIAPVDAVRTPDGIVTIDNTRVAVAREHGLKTIPVRVWEPSDPLPADMAKRFEGAATWGEALQIRLENQRPVLPPTGTIKPPRLPK